MELLAEIRKRGKKHSVRLKDMKDFFLDQDAVAKLLKKNPKIYDVAVLENKGVMFAITTIYPGTVGKEYFMTRGHYHKKPGDEVYYLIKGKGKIVMQDSKDVRVVEMKRGRFEIVPSGYAHRTVNTGKSKLVFLSIYPRSVGHDYKKIEREGFKKRVLAK